ncbi:MAG: hypothetical protein HQK52_10260 [Oligoflexia bacterium]|nr:hypothetical protein [Oligoflexia bacterium]
MLEGVLREHAFTLENYQQILKNLDSKNVPKKGYTYICDEKQVAVTDYEQYAALERKINNHAF